MSDWSYGKNEQTTRVDPRVAAYMEPLMNQMSALAMNAPGTPGFFPGDIYQNLLPEQQAALDQMLARGQGSALEGAASGALQQQLTPEQFEQYQQMLGAGGGALMQQASGQVNPLTSQMFQQAAGDLSEQFRESVIPGINAGFAQAGRTGSGLQQEALTNAAGELADAQAGLAAQMFGQASESALARQLAAGQALTGAGFQGQGLMQGAAGLAPAMSALDWQNLQNMLGAGTMRQQDLQGTIDAERERYEYEASRPLMDWQRQMAALGGAVGMTTPFAGAGRTEGMGGQVGRSGK